MSTLYYREVTKQDRSIRASSRLSKSAVVAFSGEFDIASKSVLRENLESLAAVPLLCIDLSHVDYIDSTAVGEFIRLHKHRVERGFDTETVVVGENQPIRRLLSILHLESLFRIEREVPPAFRISNDGIVDLTIISPDGNRRPIQKEAASS